MLVLATLALAAFPWGMLDDTIRRELSRSLDRPVSIGSVARVDGVSLHPVIEIRNLSIPQPDWAETDQPMLQAERIELGFSALSLLWGSVRIEQIGLEGVEARLIRRADKRTNWSGEPEGSGSGGAPLAGLSRLTLRNVAIDYRDAVKDRSFRVTLAGSSDKGLRLNGNGTVRGASVTVRAQGAGFAVRESGRWPFGLQIDGSAVGLTLQGTMGAPLAFTDLDALVSAHGSDLANVDALIEAGLPSTQPVRMAAQLYRDGETWRIEDLTGRVGRSDFSGRATLLKKDGHTRIDGELHADQFDFADLASDAGRAEAAAKTARIGERVVPDTAIDLDNLGNTDGVLRITADQLLWPGSKPFRSLDAVLELEGDTLTIAPLTFGMPNGTLAGEATVTQKDAGPELHLQLQLSEGQLADLFPSAGISAPAHGRIALTGTGDTVRAAIGAADGRVALTAAGGSIPEETALLLGQDVGGGLFPDDAEQARLRCLVAGFDFANGTATLRNVRIDTSRALTRAGGTIAFPDERLAIALNGIPKQDVTLRVEGAVPVRGTIKSPSIDEPESADSIGDFIGQLAEAIFGEDSPRAADLDCERAAAEALNF
ncbi:AsmA family protein [Sphingosinithalassobacter tenebrarum]|uniref:AsmA family protein n=1 Tax=Stakelama tenebrarum TaxID=2711215 RepID=A0A6G6Y5X7_9SPHN|nr:AsmA family protein [Sphingosinithalassobacter tenebrarum]